MGYGKDIVRGSFVTQGRNPGKGKGKTTSSNTGSSSNNRRGRMPVPNVPIDVKRYKPDAYDTYRKEHNLYYASFENDGILSEAVNASGVWVNAVADVAQKKYGGNRSHSLDTNTGQGKAQAVTYTVDAMNKRFGQVGSLLYLSLIHI